MFPCFTEPWEPLPHSLFWLKPAGLSPRILLIDGFFFTAVYSSNKNLILWSYPLVRNYDVRKQELLALSSDTRVLFIKGTKDWVSRV